MPHVMLYVASQDVLLKLNKILPELHRWMITAAQVDDRMLSINTVKTEYNGNFPRFDVFVSIRCKKNPKRTEAKMKQVCDSLTRRLQKELGIETARARYEVFESQSQVHDLAAQSKL